MSVDESVDVSVPTDLTVTSHGGDSEEDRNTTTAAAAAASRRHAREVQNLASERAELQRLVEKLKLEVENKDVQLTSMVQQMQSSVAKTVSLKDDQLSKKQIQVTSLEMELRQTREELNTLRERAARELAQLTQKCSQFQQSQKRLLIRQDELRNSLSNLHLNQEEFVKLRQTSPEALSLQQYTALRVYEMVWPLRVQMNELEAVRSSLESTLKSKDTDLRNKTEECTKLQRNCEDLQRKCEQYAGQLITLKDEQISDEFKVRNYSRVRSERDKLQQENTFLTKTNNELELTNATLRKEHGMLQENFRDLKRKQRKQEFDLSHYQELSSDLKSKVERMSKELSTVTKQLTQERDRCGELHEKYLSARGDVTQLTENNRDREHELKLLKERFGASKVQCSRLEEKVTSMFQQKEEVSAELEKSRIKFTVDTQCLETQIQELRTSLSSATKNRDALMEENSTLHQRILELDTASHEERKQRTEEISALKKELERVRNALSNFEGLPAEYEKAVKTAATLPEGESRRVLERILPVSRLQGDWAVEQCIHLTRRVMQLEGESLEAYNTIQQLIEALEHLKSTVSSYKAAIGLAGQPSSKLLERIASQEDQINTIHAALQQHTAIKATLTKENRALSQQMVKLKQVIEQGKQEAEELSAIKKKLESLLEESLINKENK